MKEQFMKTAIFLFCLLFTTASQAKETKVLDELEQLEVNGSRQWVLYRSQNPDAPVVLFVHGGPGSPLMLFSRGFDDTFLKDFIIVHWDQRLTGKSYDPNLPVSTFTLDQVVKDGLKVVDHLKKKFRRPKILLMGHSWGSIVASHMALNRPEDFISYISVGTVSDMKAGDQMKYQFLLNEVKASENKEDQETFEAMGPPPWTEFPQLVKLSRLMNKYKGSFYSLSPADLNKAVEKTKEYSQEELESLNVSMEKIWKQIFPFLEKYRASTAIPRLSLPVIFAQGKCDMATPTVLASEYYRGFSSAKGKQWVDFEKSAHFPMYEEPQKFLKLMLEAVK